MRVTPSRVVILTLLATAVVFCVVQDRVMAAGVGRYVSLQRAGMAGAAPPVMIDEVMRPAVRRSVEHGALWSAATLALGVAGAAAAGKWKERSRVS